MARLAKIRKEREEAQAKRKAETEGMSLDPFFLNKSLLASRRVDPDTFSGPVPAKAAEIEAKKASSGQKK